MYFADSGIVKDRQVQKEIELREYEKRLAIKEKLLDSKEKHLAQLEAELEGGVAVDG